MEKAAGWHPCLSRPNDLGHMPATLAWQFMKTAAVEFIEEQLVTNEDQCVAAIKQQGK